MIYQDEEQGVIVEGETDDSSTEKSADEDLKEQPLARRKIF